MDRKFCLRIFHVDLWLGDFVRVVVGKLRAIRIPLGYVPTAGASAEPQGGGLTNQLSGSPPCSCGFLGQHTTWSGHNR